MTNIENVLKRIDALSVGDPDFAVVASRVSKKIADARIEFGRVPYDILIAGMEMAGVYPAFELVVTDKEGNIYLKRRKKSENVSAAETESWEGKLYIPGSVLAPAKRFDFNFYSLLDKEFVRDLSGAEKEEMVQKWYKQSIMLGTQMSPLPERKTDALSLLFNIQIDDMSLLQEGFEVVNKANLSEVIDQHRPIIEQLLDKGTVPFILDTRDLSLR